MKTLRSLAALALAACGSLPSPSGPVDAGQDPQPPPRDAGVDAGPPPPPPDAGTLCDGLQPCNFEWSETSAFPANVDHHTTFVATSAAGTFVYVAGGLHNQTSQVYDIVRRAPVAADGSLGAWVECTKLPMPIGFHAMAQSGRYVYLMAGVSQDASGPFGHDQSLIGTVQDDGDITWVTNPNRLRAAFLHGTAVVVGETLYMFGGTGANGPQSVVKLAQIQGDGSLGPWADGPALPLQRSHHVAVVYGGHIFIAGGFDTGMNPTIEVLRSSFDANHMLTGWIVVGEVLDSPWTSAAVVYRDHLFLIGGGEGGPGQERYVNRVRRARFDGAGGILSFVDVDALPAGRAHVHQVPMYRDHLYSVGGRVSSGQALESISRVFVGKLGGGTE
ncbi:MAG: hypothetical protein JNK82_18105 [Myxococcaceae bacterium]|nr:hypothetical protein [Myxococcaceae bacterium]